MVTDPDVIRSCSVAGCQRPYLCKGYCSLHYERVRRDGQPGSVESHYLFGNEICAFPECGKQNVAKGYCHKHYKRRQIHGDPSVVLPRGLPEAARNRLHSRYVADADRRGYVFELSDIKFDKLISSDCFYCLRPPADYIQGRSANYGGLMFTGIDRVDNSIGYVESNCVPCCKLCNRAKGNLSLDDFLAWVDRLVAARNVCR